jgi:dihydropyrimidine dehydrogenase (NAD+) subunit PreA
VIVNIVGSFEIDPWVRASTAAEEAGADIIELNFSSPYRANLGLGIGRDKTKMQDIIGAVRDKMRIPVMAKLSGHLLVGQLKDYSQSAVSSGADAISITNLIAGLAGVDIETGMPKWTYRDTQGNVRGCVTGISGPAIKPLALRSVAEVASAVRVPISAIGGITTWQSAVEFMMLGATTVQIGIAAIAFGYGIVTDMTQGLRGFMQRNGYRRVTDFIGITNRKYGVGEDYTVPEMDQPRTILVDEALCDGCGKCEVVCDTNAYNAMRMVKGAARVKRERCVNCNMCLLVCPRKAITSTWNNGVLDS